MQGTNLDWEAAVHPLVAVAAQGLDTAGVSADLVVVGPCSVVAVAGSVAPGTAGER